jgi:hypothetical protein
MKKFLATAFFIALLVTLCACSPNAPKDTQTDTPVAGNNKGTWAPFEVSVWLEDADNSARFEYIAVNVFPPPETWGRGVDPTAELEADETQRKEILRFFDGVLFWVTDAPTGEQAFDFAFAMNEPFLFFTFTENELYIKVPYESSPDGYEYFKQSLEEATSLSDLKEYIGELRLGYYENQG